MPLLRNDPQLLRAFRAGERAALEAVYCHYVRSIDVYLRALSHRSGAPELRQASAVQDLLQDVFMRVFADGAREAYDEQRDFAPYVRAIARNSFVDALRKRRGEASISTDDLALCALEPSCPTADYDGQVLATLELYLDDISPDLRAVYEQRFVLGRSQQAACDTLGVTRRSLRTLEDRLRRGLRKSLLLAGLLYIDTPFSVGAFQTHRE